MSRRTVVVVAAALCALAAPSAAQAVCPTAPLTPLALTGFEHGRAGYSANNLVPSGTGASVTGAAARNGAYGLRVAANGYAGNEYYLWATAPRTGVVRFALRLDALPAANVSELFRSDTYSRSALRIGYDAASQSLRLTLNSASGASATLGGPAVDAGQWYFIDVRHTVAGPHTADWSVDGVSHGTATVSGGAENLYYARWGTTANDKFTASYDDVIATGNAADYPIGDGRVSVLRPNGSSAVGTAMRDNDGTAVDSSSWARLDEIPATSTVDFIQQTVASSSSYAEIAFEDTDDPCARAVRGYFSTHSANSKDGNNVKVVFVDGARQTVTRQGSIAANNTLSRDYSDTVFPATDWNQAALNGLVGRFGFATDVKPVPILDAILVEYEVPLP